MSDSDRVAWRAELRLDDEVQFRIGARGDEVVAEWGNLARLVARRDGSEVRLTFEPDADARMAEKIRRGSVPLLLRDLAGKLGLHGAAVTLNGRAVVLLGRSGQGKSTLAAALCAAGAALLADDCVALDPGPSAGWVVAPQERDHWLDGASRAALGLAEATEKAPVRTLRAAACPVPIVAFVELAFGGDRPTLARQRGVAAVGSLVPQVARFVLDDPERQRRELDRLHLLVETVPCLRLERPRGFTHLKCTVDRMMDLLGAGADVGVWCMHMVGDLRPSIDTRSKVRPAAKVYARPFGDEIVLLDFSAGEYFGLDVIGADVWRGLEGGRSLTEIADGLVQRYDVTLDRAVPDIVALVGELAAHGLVEVEG